jgi:hypothetical protein
VSISRFNKNKTNKFRFVPTETEVGELLRLLLRLDLSLWLVVARESENDKYYFGGGLFGGNH